MRRLWLFISPLLVFMIPSMITGGVVGVYPGYKFYEFVWKDARFCTSCHIHDYASVAWETSSHGKLTTCHDCHHQPLREYLREIIVFLTDKPSLPQDLTHVPYVPNNICQSCHVSNPNGTFSFSGPMAKEDIHLLPKVDQMHLHKVHLSAKTKAKPLKEYRQPEELKEKAITSQPSIERGKERLVSCSDCHSGPARRAHSFSVMDMVCLPCHNDAHQKSQIIKNYGCRSCHFQEFILPAKEE